MFTRLFLFALLLNSCVSDYSDIKKINRKAIFHCNSSKIWVINKVLKVGVNYAALKLKDKDVLIFYGNGKIVIQPMNTLGTFPIKNGLLILSDDNTSCEFNFPKEKWQFKTVEINSKLISLKAKKNSAFLYDLELIPYPESEKL
jgi:hypothetical protein